MKDEDKNRIFKAIQKVVNKNPVIVIGCGFSMNYGLPGMSDLAEKIKKDFTENQPETDESKKYVKTLIDNLNRNLGLEDAMLSVKCTEEVENRVIHIVWKEIEIKNEGTIDDFVRDDTRPAMSDLIDHIIYGRKEFSVNIVTTNYDCLIEYSVSQTKAYINCGCSQPVVGRFVGFASKDQYAKLNDYTGCVNIYKIHGSIDWFVDNNGRIVYYPNRAKIPENMKPCIITPGDKKYERTFEEPHRSLIYSVDALFESASGYLCIGYGFNDKHIQPKLLKNAIEKNKTILIVTKDLTDKIKSEVIDHVPNYLIVYSDGARGTKFKSSEESCEYTDETIEFWKLEKFMSILR